MNGEQFGLTGREWACALHRPNSKNDLLCVRNVGPEASAHRCFVCSQAQGGSRVLVMMAIVQSQLFVDHLLDSCFDLVGLRATHSIGHPTTVATARNSSGRLPQCLTKENRTHHSRCSPPAGCYKEEGLPLLVLCAVQRNQVTASWWRGCRPASCCCARRHRHQPAPTAATVGCRGR